MKKDALILEIEELVKPITDELSYELYNVEFVKEDGENYLRIYIDNENGIKLTDCEAVSRRVSEMLDEVDPISVGYFLEVSSPGINRGLYCDEHFERYVGSKVILKLKKALNGTKTITGMLKGINDDYIIVQAEEEVNIPKDILKSANIEGDF
ncbi:MAG: ribosome maturation factor RimP [Clostridium sp.]|uniref:ribosome maturation factor RimP n=1 Tax=Clostridium TaxID=1485 RepID=UPI00215231CD|nr:ribosome maturation factor RimP [Clostridium sp. LY3-2]MCR6515266.1 ribosome maturation factor RimP [Clostridium sp. LY3-2]